MRNYVIEQIRDIKNYKKKDLLSNFFNSLQRITSSNKFIPEIDGLRFVAIISVLLYHINGFIIEKNIHVYVNNDFKEGISNILKRGHLGVELFFVISGFILSYPFASHYISGTHLPTYRQYLIRRLTRLEPPYILVMTLLFFSLIFIGKYTFSELFPSLIASLTYTHNFFFDGLPMINAVAWSLEVEFQFYLLAPLIATIFIFPRVYRYAIILPIILLFVFLQNYFTSISLLKYLHYFLIGFILTDLSHYKNKLKINNFISVVVGIFSFSLIWYCDTIKFSYEPLMNFFLQLLLVFSIFIFYYLVLYTPIWNKIFSVKWLTIMGGMCYSIYLLHYPFISIFGNLLLSKFKFSNYYFIDFIILNIIFILIISIVSILFFKLVEQPCMKKDWYIKWV